MALTIFGIEGIGEITPQSDWLGQLLLHYTPQAHDVLVISSKAVAKAEGNVLSAADIIPSAFAHTLAQRIYRTPEYCELVLRESAEIVRMSEGVVICRTHHGFVMANAGVDGSNTGGADRYLLLPKDPDASARKIVADIAARTGVQVAVILSDTFGRAWRVGQTDLAIGVAGIAPLRDYTGQPDADGREMRWTSLAQADELASAAELVRGKTKGIPVVVVRGYDYTPQEAHCAEQLMPKERDLFR